ncbi:MAG: SurA N-terminal domain-containing protein [Halocynthiibacter sp.]
MSEKPKSKASQFFVGIMFLMIIVGLSGFGVTNFGGGVTAVATVGDSEISTDEYYRAMTQEMNALSAQTGSRIPFATAKQFGLDARVLETLINQATLDHETGRIGVSIGNEAVRDQLLAIPQFQSLSGGFDRDAYRMTLENIGSSESEFENNLRRDAARALTQTALFSAVEASPEALDILTNYTLETRDFTWARLDQSNIDPIAPADDATLMTYYTANPEAFTAPEKKRLTYVSLTPEMLLETIDVAETELKTIYEERADLYQRPERRLVERIVFNSLDDAKAADEALRSGQKTFETVVRDLGLTLADIDLGDVGIEELDKAARDTIFKMDTAGVTPMIETDLGPAIYRMNSVIAALNTPFDDVKAELKREFGLDQARREIDAQISEIEDLVAGGSTLEEIQEDSPMVLATMDWFEEADAPLNRYDSFREAARAASEDSFPEIIELDDGGIFLLRQDEIIAPKLAAFEDSKALAAMLWAEAELKSRLNAKADEVMTQLSNGQSLDALGLTSYVEEALSRTDFVANAPDRLVTEVFGLEANGTVKLDLANAVVVAQLTATNAVDPTSDATLATKSALKNVLAQNTASDVITTYMRAIQTQAGVNVNQGAIAAVQAQIQ